MEQKENETTKNLSTKEGAKYGGRQKGTPNKVNADLRKQLADILDVGMEQFMIDLDQLKARERVDAFLQIAKFVIPTMKAVELTDKTPEDQVRRVSISFEKK